MKINSNINPYQYVRLYAEWKVEQKFEEKQSSLVRKHARSAKKKAKH